MLLLACLALLSWLTPMALATVSDAEDFLVQPIASSYGLRAGRRQVDGPWWSRTRTRSTSSTSAMLTVPNSGPPPAPTPSPTPLILPSPPVSDLTSVPTQEPAYPTTSSFSTPTGFWTPVPPAPSTRSSSTPASEKSPESSNPGTGAMPKDTTSTTAAPTTSRSPESSNSSGNDNSGIGSNKTLVITLSTVLSVVGLLLIAGGILICWRYRRRGKPLFARGISPIDDDEIATWKVPRSEKAAMMAVETDVEGEAGTAAGAQYGRSPSHTKHTSTGSVKKPPSVIVYSNAHGQGGGYRKSEEDGSPRSFAHSLQSPYGKTSLDKALPQTPIQARAPNARAGLTDESIPGDDPFLPSPRRQPSRLSKMPPNLSSSSPRRPQHTRARSSRSSTHSFGGYGYVGSDVGLSTRHSHDNYTSSHRNNHSRVYSSSSIPPRLSFGDEGPIGGVFPRPLFRDDEIGRAIG